MNPCESPGYCSAPLRDKQISVFSCLPLIDIHECSISYATKKIQCLELNFDY